MDTEVDAKAFIYASESSGRTDAVNPSSGACGLRQSLPCAKMPCSLSDYSCQDNYFTQYEQKRFGSWEAAKSYWLCTGTCTDKLGTVIKTDNWW